MTKYNPKPRDLSPETFKEALKFLLHEPVKFYRLVIFSGAWANKLNDLRPKHPDIKEKSNVE